MRRNHRPAPVFLRKRNPAFSWKPDGFIIAGQSCVVESERQGDRLNCPKCGAFVEEGAGFCGSCGQSMPDRVSDQTSSPFQARFAAPRLPIVYAGFWLRLVAYIIDSFLLGFVLGNLLLRPLVGRPGGIPANNPWVLFTSTSPQISALLLLFLMGNWVYYSLMESSPWRATVGKKILGLEVTDLSGNRISFARASGRFFGKIVSSMTFLVGFAMAGFTARKQALHDILASCLVTRKV